MNTLIKYVVTDPCYILSDDKWDECCKFLDDSPKAFNDAVSKALTELTGFSAFACDTGFGDWSNKIWCYDKPEFKIPNWANENLINEVLGESFLPRLAAVLAETIPNRTAHTDEKLEDYPQRLSLKNHSKDELFNIPYDTIAYHPVVGFELRNYPTRTTALKYNELVNILKILYPYFNHKQIENKP